MKPTEQAVKDSAKQYLASISPQEGEPRHVTEDFTEGANWAISQMQPEWVQIEYFLTTIENGLSEHIALLKEVNKGNQFNNVDMWDYQTAAESNEAIIELRRILTPPPPNKVR